MNIKEYSEDLSFELQSILQYMTDELYNEFPAKKVTPEYLILSFLDKTQAHASLILQNLLTSDDIETLREAYADVLSKHMYIRRPKQVTIVLNKDLEKILALAEDEAEALGEETLATQHLLLALLNPRYKFDAASPLIQMGVTYDKIIPTFQKTQKSKPKEAPSDNIQSKSAINTKTETTQNGKYEFITKYTININNLIKENKIDDFIGREQELKQLIKVLARRKKNNILLVGEGGCGTTSLVHGLAQRIIDKTVPSFLEDKEIVMLNVVGLVSGTNFRGMFEERIDGLFRELKSSKKYILLLDDIQSVLRNSNRDTDADLSSSLGMLLSGGEVCVIATTTQKDYHTAVESRPQIARKFQKIIIEPASEEETINILESNKHYYEDFHGVTYSNDLIQNIVKLANRYITTRRLPDSALDLMDTVGAHVSLNNEEDSLLLYYKKQLKEVENTKSILLNQGKFEDIDDALWLENELKQKIADFKRDKKKNLRSHKVTEDEVFETLSEMVKIPVGKLSTSEKEKVAHIDDILKQSIIGQDEAIESICRVIKRHKIGLGDKSKTQGVFLCCGPTGVGKTLLAKKLAEEIYGDEKALVRIDMSEYSEKNSIAKLTGAAPGYIGYDNGGQLTEAIKNKQYCVLLLDEIEKANEEVYNIFLQLFDEGRLTDSSGQIVNFKNIIVIMTSNIGAKAVSDFGKGMGFTPDTANKKQSIIAKELKNKFTPEFLNRIDNIVYFNSLEKEDLNKITELELNKLDKRLNELEYNLSYNEDVVNYITSLSVTNIELGARPIIRLVQENIEDMITDLMLSKDYPKGHTFTASMVKDMVLIQ